MNQNAYLAGVNAAVSVLFVPTGLWLRRESGQGGVAWMLIAVGLLRSLDFADAWSGSPWALYDLIFGAADRVFGAWACAKSTEGACGTKGIRCAGRRIASVSASKQGNGGRRTQVPPYSQGRR